MAGDAINDLEIYDCSDLKMITGSHTEIGRAIAMCAKKCSSKSQTISHSKAVKVHQLHKL